MKEQVILDRHEYLELKEKADLNKEEIEQLAAEKADKEIHQTLFEFWNKCWNGYYDGFRAIMWGSNNWEETPYTIQFKLAKDELNKKNYYGYSKAIGELIADLVQENREHIEKEDLNEIVRNDIIKTKDEFNRLPWYKKMFFKF